MSQNVINLNKISPDFYQIYGYVNGCTYKVHDGWEYWNYEITFFHNKKMYKIRTNTKTMHSLKHVEGSIERKIKEITG